MIHDWFTVSKLKRYNLIQTSNTTTRFQWPLWFGLEGILFLQNWFDDLHGNELRGTKFITNFFQSFVSHDIVGYILLTRIVCFYISFINFDYCKYFNINTTLEKQFYHIYFPIIKPGSVEIEALYKYSSVKCCIPNIKFIQIEKSLFSNPPNYIA